MGRNMPGPQSLGDLLVSGGTHSGKILNDHWSIWRRSFKPVCGKPLTPTLTETAQLQQHQAIEINVACRDDYLSANFGKTTEAIDEPVHIEVIHVLNWVVQH